MDIEPLIPVKRPILAEPIEFASVQGEINCKRFIEDQGLNIVNFLKTLGYDPRHDYLTPERQKFLAKLEKDNRDYEEAKAAVIANINAVGTKRITDKINIFYDGKKFGLNQKIIEEGKYPDGKPMFRFETTPYEICSHIFDSIYAEFSTNPITEPKQFQKEAFSKFHDHVISKHIQGVKFSKSGEESPIFRPFEIKFEWKF